MCSCSLESESRLKRPLGAPAWLPATIWEANVKKVGIEKLEKI